MFQAWLVNIAKMAAHSAPSWLPGKEPHEEDYREGEKAEHRHGLQNVEGRNDEDFGSPALGRQRLPPRT